MSACSVGDSGSIPGLGRSPGTGNGNPLQSSCLEWGAIAFSNLPATYLYIYLPKEREKEGRIYKFGKIGKSEKGLMELFVEYNFLENWNHLKI